MSIELQNCLEEARQYVAQANAKAWTLISRLVNEGKVLVISRRAAYCKATDALAGEYVSLERAFWTREEATAFLQSIPAELWEDGERQYNVWPLALEPAPAPPVNDTDDLPF